jgi:putative hydrolase of the HAD superfamily
MPSVTHVFFDIGGVLGTNGWDREQRSVAKAQFRLSEDFDSRHGEVVAEWEIGRLTLDEYLDFTVFHAPRDFTREEFVGTMLALSQPFQASIDAATRVAEAKQAKLFTLNNEPEALNVYRIERFGLRSIFEGFLSSCWLGILKPSPLIFERALGIAQVQAADALLVDDREQNLIPARKLGMQVHLFDGDAERLTDVLAKVGAL